MRQSAFLLTALGFCCLSGQPAVAHQVVHQADDLLGLSSPQILDRRGKVFLANGNEVRRLRKSQLRNWLFEHELRAVEQNLKSHTKICVVRTGPTVTRLRVKSFW